MNLWLAVTPAHVENLSSLGDAVGRERNRETETQREREDPATPKARSTPALSVDGRGQIIPLFLKLLYEFSVTHEC